MSFTELKLADLKKVSESFGVDISDVKTKQEVIARIEEEGISYQMYDKFLNSEKEDIQVSITEKKKREKLDKSNSVLIRMDRANLSYVSHGYTFTQEHPFMAMPEETAQDIFDKEEGFRLATPREANEFYS